MRQLLWKEWHEQSWKLGFGCLVLGALAVIGLRARVVPDVTMMMTVCFVGMALLPVLASTGLVPAERGEGSFESLIALPVAPWRILLVKTMAGALLCAGPLIVSAAASLAVAGTREIPLDGTILLYSRSILTALSLLIWMMALTIHLPNETRAGLLSLGILIGWLIAEFGIDKAATHASSPWFLALTPFSFVYMGQDLAAPLAVTLVEQGLIAAALWAWASTRMTAFSEAPQ